MAGYKMSKIGTCIWMERDTAVVDRIWAELSPAWTILMPLDVYPFSERYGLMQDRFGISWQVVPKHGKPGRDIQGNSGTAGPLTV